MICFSYNRENHIPVIHPLVCPCREISDILIADAGRNRSRPGFFWAKGTP